MPRFAKPCPFSALATPCRVHGLEIEGRDCGEAAAQWITGFLKSQPYRLVHFEPHMQPRKPHQIKPVFRHTEQVRGAPPGFGLWGALWKAVCVGGRLLWELRAGHLQPLWPGTRLLSSALGFARWPPGHSNRQKHSLSFPWEHRLCFWIAGGSCTFSHEHPPCYLHKLAGAIGCRNCSMVATCPPHSVAA